MAPTLAPEALSPEESLERLREGNRRFVRGEGSALRTWHPGLADGQAPFAVVLGCADSRAPAEYVFDQGLGDLFVIRVAGNIVAPSLVGSAEFAASKFGTRLVVVMGHTHCGAVGATMTALEQGGPPASSNLRSIVERIAPNVQHLFDGPDAPSTMYGVAVRANAVASARALRASSPFLEKLSAEGRVKIVASVYDLETGVVTFYDD
ncbi:MAG TPA: carbonic anhydrase [Polyangiaceae bacterium]|jgi:carbonic anhydrase